MKVAVLGVGAMGGAMARTLARAGLEVTVWNRTSERAVRLARDIGATVVDSPRAATDVDVAITTLADGAAVEQVLVGRNGILDGARQGLVVCEMSTVEPEISRRLEPMLTAAGMDLLDAPVSGSISLVEQGALTIMAGGSVSALARARPVLEHLSARLFHLGPIGNGASMKLAVNAVVHALNSAVSESLVLAEAAGIDRALAYEVIEASAAGAPFVAYKHDAFLHPESAPVAFRLALVQKDIEIITALADRLGVSMAQSRAGLEVVRKAVPRFGERDMSVLAEHLRQSNHVVRQEEELA